MNKSEVVQEIIKTKKLFLDKETTKAGFIYGSDGYAWIKNRFLDLEEKIKASKMNEQEIITNIKELMLDEGLEHLNIEITVEGESYGLDVVMVNYNVSILKEKVC